MKNFVILVIGFLYVCTFGMLCFIIQQSNYEKEMTKAYPALAVNSKLNRVRHKMSKKHHPKTKPMSV